MTSAHPLPGISLLKGSRIVINHIHGTKTGKVLCCNEPTAYEPEWRMAVLFDDDSCSACSVSAVDVTATLEIQNEKTKREMQ